MQVKNIAECSLEDSANFLTFIKLPVVIKIFVLSILSGRFTQDKCQYILNGYTLLSSLAQ